MKEASLWYASFPNQEGAKALCCEHPGQAQCFPNSLGNGTLPEEIPAFGGDCMLWTKIHTGAHMHL